MQLTDRSVKAVATLSKLESARFNNIENITDEGVRALADRPRKTLKRLHLSYCTSITSQSILVLLKNQPQIDFLSLTAIPSFLNDADIESLSKPAGKVNSKADQM